MIGPLTTFKIQSYYTSNTSRLIDVIDSAITPQTLSIPLIPITVNSIAYSNQLSGAANSNYHSFFSTLLIQLILNNKKK